MRDGISFHPPLRRRVRAWSASHRRGVTNESIETSRRDGRWNRQLYSRNHQVISRYFMEHREQGRRGNTVPSVRRFCESTSRGLRKILAIKERRAVLSSALGTYGPIAVPTVVCNHADFYGVSYYPEIYGKKGGTVEEGECNDIPRHLSSVIEQSPRD